MDQKLGKSYKLCSHKRIQALFKVGKSVRCFPLVGVYSIYKRTDGEPFQLVISAPKRQFKKAHDRNRVKRLMKEAIRENKLTLSSYLLEQQLQIDLFISYTNPEIITVDRLSQKINQLFKLIIHDLAKTHSNETTL